ncbi:MAG: TetR/AcrR family transcriptional regulator [Myxococcota bacterium]
MTRSEGEGSRRRRAPDEKRNRILEAAQLLFSERGYAETSTAEIARQAGVSEGIVFHHFGNKQGLLGEVAAAFGRGASLAMFAGISPDQPPDAYGMIRRVFEYCRDHGLLHQMLVHARDPSDWNVAMQAHRRVIISSLTEAFTRWKASGHIHTDRPELAAPMLFGLVESALINCFGDRDGEDWEAYLEEAVRLIEGALYDTRPSIPRPIGAVRADSE